VVRSGRRARRGIRIYFSGNDLSRCSESSLVRRWGGSRGPRAWEAKTDLMEMSGVHGACLLLFRWPTLPANLALEAQHGGGSGEHFCSPSIGGVPVCFYNVHDTG